MSDAKFKSLDVYSLSVAQSGYNETMGFTVSAGPVTLQNNDPEKTIISLTIPASTKIRTGKWEVTWSFEMGTGAYPPINHYLYFKRNGVTQVTRNNTGTAVIPFRFSYTSIQTIVNGVSAKFDWTGLENTSSSYPPFRSVYTKNEMIVKWIQDV